MSGTSGWWRAGERATDTPRGYVMYALTTDSEIRQQQAGSPEGHKEATKGSLFSQSKIMKHSARQMKRGSRIIL